LTELADSHQTTQSPRMTTQEFDLDTLSEQLLADWLHLTTLSGSGAFFASPMFVRTFHEIFGDRVAVSILCFHATDGTLCGLVPLMRHKVRRGPSFSVRYGYQMTDFDFLDTTQPRLTLPAAQLSTPLGLEATALRSEILATPEMRLAVLAAIPAAIAKLGNWNVGIFVVDEDDSTILSQGPLPSRRRPLGRELKFMSNVRPADALVALQSKKFRQNVRRSVKFSAEAGVEFKVTRGIDDIQAAMDDMDDLVKRSWKASGAGGRAATEEVFIPFNARQRHFFKRLTQIDEAEPVIAAAYIDGVMVAAILMLVHCNRLLTFLTYSDLAHARLGIGRLTLHAGIDFAHQEGVAEIDYNSNAKWTIPYTDRVSVRGNTL